jgi:hypothetical protein
MTLPDLPARRKRPNRWWLYGPYLAVALAALGWCGAWFWIKGRVEARLNEIAAHAAVGGPSVGWDRMSVSGFPFRIEVVLDGARAGAPSGWGASAPQIRAETYAYDLRHWIAYAPNGIVLNRPGAGPVNVTGEALRASVVTERAGQPRVSLEGVKLAFAQKPGDRPFPLVSAGHFDAHTRPAGPNEVEFLVQLSGAKFSPDGLIGRLARGAPVSSAWHGALSKAGALGGRDWPGAAREWATEGGTIVLAAADLDAGAVRLQASGGLLTIGPDGRLRGGLTFALPHVAESLSALGAAGALSPALAHSAADIAAARAAANPTGKVDLAFEAGTATLGPLAIGPSPRVY